METLEKIKESLTFKYVERAMEVYGFAPHNNSNHDAYWYYELMGYLLDRIDADIANVSYPPCVRILTNLRYYVIGLRADLFNLSVPF